MNSQFPNRAIVDSSAGNEAVRGTKPKKKTQVEIRDDYSKLPLATSVFINPRLEFNDKGDFVLLDNPEIHQPPAVNGSLDKHTSLPTVCFRPTNVQCGNGNNSYFY